MTKRVQGRDCGECSLCCKLIAVNELKKPEGVWCEHCDPGHRRCRIYDQRPLSCQGFYCGWLQESEFGPEWKPTKAKMVLAAEGDGNKLTIYVDPSFPTNWRKEPYYSQLKALAHTFAQHRTQLVVRINDRAIVMLPNKEVDLGRFKNEDHIVVARNPVTGELDARLIKEVDVPQHLRGKWTSS